MAARFLFEADIMGSGIEKASESSYAYIATQLLPNGMLGMLIAAMFAATMSSMDSGLNAQVGNIARNIIPRLRGALGYHKELAPKTEIRICHISTIVLGVIIITYAMLLASQSEIALFDAYLIIGSVIGVPMGFPLLMGLWLKKLPKWSYFPIFIACMLPSIWSFIDGKLYDNAWTIQERTLWILIFGCGSTVICRLLYFMSSKKSRDQVDEFFTLMHSPIDYEKEVGSSVIDYEQYFVLSKAVLGVGGAVLFLLLVPNDFMARLCIVFVSIFIIVAGGLLHWGGRRTRRRVELILAEREASSHG